jgi:hypothetical protein
VYVDDVEVYREVSRMNKGGQVRRRKSDTSPMLVTQGDVNWLFLDNFLGGPLAKVCGSDNEGWNERRQPVSLVIAHSAQTLTMRVTTTLDQAGTDERYAQFGQ